MKTEDYKKGYREGVLDILKNLPKKRKVYHKEVFSSTTENKAYNQCLNDVVEAIQQKIVLP